MKTSTKLKFVNKAPEGTTAPYRYVMKPNPDFKIPSNHLLTPHWHPNSNEITTCIKGEGTVTIIAPNTKYPGNPGTAIPTTYPLKEGDSVFLQQGYFHYFMNTGNEDFEIDLTFDKKDFDILTLSEVISLLPDNIKLAAVNSKPDNPIIPYEKIEVDKKEIVY
ncbi:hypothetical protein CXF68_14005 [Tenacibaculum sp. Bg11-29]|uniref:cupin domain-containing protein n=1 Tax=Tenacibaculum sp. Bg11-29 TaxID=2058306 RepID=UPI000C328F28|nr:cupin domain-containing protein [Tenacibaculum sp. Bg11-29]PKH51728.1 hypothetical protein CXF68_14005 [Tenacibaculum sp. Bg11-29]